jgi:DNA-binding LacI/PurR family transcriptional regulator
MLETETKSNMRFQKYILDKIASTKPGEKLPSLREIRKRYSISQSSVDRIMDELRTSGLVDILPRKGYFKSKDFCPSIKILFFGSLKPFSEPKTLYNEMLADIIMALSANGRKADFEILDFIKDSSYFKSKGNYRTPFQHLSETIITFRLSAEDLTYVEELEGKGYKLLHFLPNFSERYRNSIVIKDEDIIKIQIEYLLNKGHKKIAYLHRMTSKRWVRPANRRYEAFCRMAIEYGLEVKPDYLKYIDNKNMSRDIGNAVGELLNCTPRPTAFILSGDRWIKEVYEAIREAGLEPGKDIAVIGTNNRVWADYVSPGLTSVGFGSNEIPGMKGTILRMIDLVKLVEFGEEFQAHEIPVSLFERKSVQTLN